MEKFKRPAHLNLVLVAPEIPGNTGSIGRTCIALNARLILIHPLGFDISEKAVRRAGLDYWKYIDLTEYQSFDEFITTEKPEIENLFLFTKTAGPTYFQAEFLANSYLIFGSETKGLPHSVLSPYVHRHFSLPMFSDKVRSLNLANAATAAAYECLRQQQRL